MSIVFLIQDAMSVARNIIKNPKLVPGGGATELTVSATLKQKSSSVEGIEKVISIPSWGILSFILFKCGILIIEVLVCIIWLLPF